MKKIAIIGAPGVGKSTIASGLHYEMKVQGLKAELVPELVKYKVFKGVDFSKDGFDIQNTIEQKDFEEVFENTSEIDYLICEAPLCNGYFYASFYEKELELPVLKKVAAEKINTYDVIFFVKRENMEYSRFGRKESFEQSLKLESHIKEKLVEIGAKKPIFEVSCQVKIKDILTQILPG